MTFLFASDEDLRREQKAAVRLPRGVTLHPDQERNERILDEREVREHRRWRQFAFLLFIAPALASLFAGAVGWLVLHFMIGQRSP